MVETQTTIDLTEDEILEILERGSQERLGMSAADMRNAYDRGLLANPGDVADLLSLADLVDTQA